ncbi:hypothetical protein GALL_462320 [mine drainage metagenome]|uniref:Uncharacterized protein n=1 Tax=mine drainage metagenome TaxID=410659 RepID=A0A1J5PMW4_9ZZZZ
MAGVMREAIFSSAAKRSLISLLICWATIVTAPNCCSPKTRCKSWRNTRLTMKTSDQMLKTKITSVRIVTRVLSELKLTVFIRMKGIFY